MFEKIINRLDDKLNPILVKELRQSTNSRVLTILVIAFLSIQLFGLYIQVFMGNATSFDSRQAIFETVLTILIASCIYGIIPTVSNRFFRERNGDSIDLIYTTVLSPFAVISGKMLSAVGLIVLLYSLCTPFIFISYLFPGVDILTIVWSLWYSFWIIVAIAQFMILIATIKTTKIMRSVVLLGYFIGITFFSLSLVPALLFSRHGGLMMDIGFGRAPWYAHLIIMAFLLLIIGFLYVLSVCAVTADHANRALWPRLYAAGMWLAGLLFVIGMHIFSTKSDANEANVFWLGMSTLLFLCFMGAASGEREKYGNRVRRYIPRNKFLRLLYFPFFSGEINGIVYSITFLALTALIFSLLPSNTRNWERGVITIVGLAGYFTWYSLLALQIKRMFVRRFPNMNSFLIMLFAVIVFTLAPMLLACGIYHRIDPLESDIAPFLILSFGIMTIKEYTKLGLAIGWGACLFTLIILGPFLIRRIKEFVPLEKPTEQETDIEANE